MIVRFVQMRQSYQTKTVFTSRLSVECFEFVYCEVKTTTFVKESGEVEQLLFCQNQFKEKPMRNLESISKPTDSNSCSSKNTSFPKEGH